MPESQKRKEGILQTPPGLPTSSPLIPSPQQRKHWAKQYRTEIAASSSSILSTFAAVSWALANPNKEPFPLTSFSTLSIRSRLACKRCLAPLASVTLVRTVSFSIYQKAKYTYSAAIGQAIGEEPLVTVNRPGSIPTAGTMLCFGAAGATAGGMVAAIACMDQVCQRIAALLTRSTGPFELTKLSSQISVLMAKSSTSSVDDPVRSSYQQKGTLSTARNIIMHRGILGLYSGFGFHLCMADLPPLHQGMATDCANQQ
ncbi:MAG: hypothetical protein Q9212_002291 [Teloschistes hypoglaucus]